MRQYNIRRKQSQVRYTKTSLVCDYLKAKWYVLPGLFIGYHGIKFIATVLMTFSVVNG